MPAPDPHAIYWEENADGSIRYIGEICQYGNRKHRLARFHRVLRRIKYRGWTCRWCGEEIGLHKRADARYCREGCRKAEARARRARRKADIYYKSN